MQSQSNKSTSTKVSVVVSEIHLEIYGKLWLGSNQLDINDDERLSKVFGLKSLMDVLQHPKL